MEHAVARLEDLSDGVFLHITIGGREIGVCRWSDEIFAVRNKCPHVGGPVCGFVREHLGAGPDPRSPWDPTAQHERPVVVCAWHKWEFDLRTREAVTSSRLKVTTYPVTVRDGTVYVDVPQRER